MQLFPCGVLLVWVSTIDTTARATRVGVGIGFTAPNPLASIEASVDSHRNVSGVSSTKRQGGRLRLMGRAWSARTGTNLSLPAVMRHVFAMGIVKPFNPA